MTEEPSNNQPTHAEDSPNYFSNLSSAILEAAGAEPFDNNEEQAQGETQSLVSDEPTDEESVETDGSDDDGSGDDASEEWKKAKTQWKIAKRRKKKYDNDLMQLNKERDVFLADKQRFTEIMGAINDLKSGEQSKVTDALGRLFGKSGHEAYEDITRGIIASDSPISRPQDVEIKKEIQELKELFMRNQKEYQAQQEQELLEKSNKRILQLSGDVENYPITAQFIKDPNRREAVMYDIRNMYFDAYSKDNSIDLDEIIEQYEERLSDLRNIFSETVSPSNKETAGLDTSSAKLERKPEKAQRPPGVTISASSEAGSLKEMSRAEEIALLDKLLRQEFDID